MDYIGGKIYQVHSVTQEGYTGVFCTSYLKEARDVVRRINNKGKSCSLVVYQCVDIEDYPYISQMSLFDEVEDVPQSS